jgi:glucosamine--fructose-6-phosphate aminotransferase (isomerizing)
MKIIEGAYLADILDQPRAIAATVEGMGIDSRLAALAAGLREGRFARAILTGMGSSLYALHPLQIELAEAGFTPVLVETAELLNSLPRLLEGALIIAVSQSGRSAEIVRLVGERSAGTALIGVTNTPESPLAAGADAVLLTDAGEEFSVSCKTYVAALAALGLLGAVLRGADAEACRAELGKAAGAAGQYLAGWREHAEQLAWLMDTANMTQLFLVGRGASLAAALTGGLILKESTHTAAEGMSSAAFRHGPLEMAGPGTVVLVFGGDGRLHDLTRRLCNDIRKVGGTVMAIGPNAGIPALALPEVPAALLPILELLPVEMVTLALAARKDMEAGCFSHASKVTTVE